MNINHVKSPRGIQAAAPEPTALPTLPVNPKLGPIDSLRVDWAQSASNRDVAKHQIQAHEIEAKKTISSIAQMTGAIARAEAFRQSQTVLDTIQTCMLENYTVTTQVQAQVRQAAHDDNTDHRNAAVQAAHDRYTGGKITTEQAQQAMATADDLRADNERRIAQRYQALTEATDASFDNAMVSVGTVSRQRHI